MVSIKRTKQLTAGLIIGLFVYAYLLPVSPVLSSKASMFPMTQYVGGWVNLNFGGTSIGAFSASSTVRVYVGGVEAEVVDFNKSAGSLYFIAPEIQGGNVTAYIVDQIFSFGYLGISFNQGLRYISSATPELITPGVTTVTVKGGGFGQQLYQGALSLGGVDITSATWSATEIRFVAPAGIERFGLLKLRRYYLDEAGGHILAPSFRVVLKPTISSVRSADGFSEIYGGYEVEILGSGFDLSSGSQDLYWGGTRILPTWNSSTRIEFIAPDVLDSRQIRIVTTVDGGGQDVAYSPGLVQILGSPTNDALAKFQTYLNQIQVPEAWALGEGSEEVVVAVIDSGISTNNPDFTNSIWTNTGEILGDEIDNDDNGYVDDVHGYDFVSDQGWLVPTGDHGTAVAGIIGAEKNNGYGLTGISSIVSLMPLQIVSDETYTDDDVIEAIRYAADNGAHIINLSLGGRFLTKYDEAIRYAYDRNVTIVVAAGNTDQLRTFGYNLDLNPLSPVCNDVHQNMVIGVASVDGQDRPSDFTSYGYNCVDVVAPGDSILTWSEPIYSSDFANWKSGTSFAAPMVSGIAALLKSKYPTMTNREIIDRIINTTDPINFDSKPLLVGKLGSGRVNAYQALSLPYIPEVQSQKLNTTIEEDTGVDDSGSLFERLRGYILLQVESLGEAWYVHPDNAERYYMKDGSTAYNMMRSFGLGITDEDLMEIPDVASPDDMLGATNYCGVSFIADSVKGKILLQVQQHGEAWYVHPDTCRRIYMKDGDAAYSIMRYLSLGITNNDLDSISIGQLVQ